jgi:putative transposase
VTLRARDALPSLRSAGVFPSLRRSLAASHKAAFRVVHFSVQSDHVHLVVEGDAPEALVRGVQGLAGRCAKAVNRAVGRRGRVWSSRFHSHALRTPNETRRGLVYVLLNFRKHLGAAPGIDPRSSGAWFEGWRTRVPAPRGPTPVEPPKTWLATIGWSRVGGPIAIDERPGIGRASATSATLRGHRRAQARSIH